ncbi:carnitine O-palmitoyltransferase 1, liver isoform isoform X2 [Harmonia axyridis]|uniref:carnitine O-palmitoyltransferase 1, liver isoform isoform X2 n=1 Tax=Harmonia axyridis TaxID=115357 RepID=UPI001E278012|nr:carnitine O-palmitoyltransferase 1, liver isoform isoform X2 [Harmonia axyridis]XP_045462963.1 carnitine O-palmitoyltransferase 1, liver isoform isoform X2 [Harmonia axyridis]
MAEAHSAVAFSFAITHEGWDVNFDREVLHLVWQSGIRSWKKRIARFQNSIHNGVFPGHMWSLWMLITLVTAVHFSGYKVPLDLTSLVLKILPGCCTKMQILACVAVALTYWLSVVFLLRYTFKLLLMYKGWMFEARGKMPSLPTKLWAVAIKILRGWNTPKLYSYQGSLPRLPLPSVQETLQRYLRSVRPLLDDKQYERTKKLGEEFENGISKKLQRYLVLKSWWSTNYVSDWWEEYVYLRGRSPLMINSNFYAIDAIQLKMTNKQIARAASTIHSALVFRRLVERQELEPIFIQGTVPLCSWQYERIFNTTRIPGIETDKIQHIQDSNHIVVYHKGKYFKVVIYKGRILKPCEIQIQLQHILDDKTEPLPGEEKLAALTAGERKHWANTRNMFFSRGANKTSLDIIEKAAFVVALDDFPYEYDENDSTKLDEYAKCLLHGKGYDRWFDKSFTLCFGTNGKVGFNAEHSWADAPVMGHLWEHVILDAIGQRYDENGNAAGTPELTPPIPVRLNWDMKHECRAAIDKAVTVAEALIRDVDLTVYIHNSFGKGFMKKAKLSPDAFIQMALQLAYYREAGKFCLTYEASMTRLFREGRTETVRPCTIESSDFVKAMENKEISNEERLQLLSKACERHQLGYQEAMCGKGIDRHLFCLYVVSKYLEVDSPFLQEVLSEPWKLSTSQTPHGQTGRIDLNKNPECMSAGGGFGPVADDGYGVSYIIAGEDRIFFHISNKRSSKYTDCHGFARELEKALNDLRTLCSTRMVTNGKKD